MAHSVQIPTRCPYCDKPPAVLVFDRYDKSLGHFCQEHGERRLLELRRGEQLIDKAHDAAGSYRK